jgi:hypothetical protein
MVYSLTKLINWLEKERWGKWWKWKNKSDLIIKCFDSIRMLILKIQGFKSCVRVKLLLGQQSTCFSVHVYVWIQLSISFVSKGTIISPYYCQIWSLCCAMLYYTGWVAPQSRMSSVLILMCSAQTSWIPFNHV